jgi:hypothetical protein
VDETAHSPWTEPGGGVLAEHVRSKLEESVAVRRGYSSRARGPPPQAVAVGVAGERRVLDRMVEQYFVRVTPAHISGCNQRRIELRSA